MEARRGSHRAKREVENRLAGPGRIAWEVHPIRLRLRLVTRLRSRYGESLTVKYTIEVIDPSSVGDRHRSRGVPVENPNLRPRDGFTGHRIAYKSAQNVEH